MLFDETTSSRSRLQWSHQLAPMDRAPRAGPDLSRLREAICERSVFFTVSAPQQRYHREQNRHSNGVTTSFEQPRGLRHHWAARINSWCDCQRASRTIFRDQRPSTLQVANRKSVAAAAQSRSENSKPNNIVGQGGYPCLNRSVGYN